MTRVEPVNRADRADNLLPDDVADLAGELGYPIDRRNVTRALEAHRIDGVVPPPRRGIAWTIPRAALVDVLAACLERRALRGLAPHGGRPRPFHAYRVAAAERVLAHPELRRLVPCHLALEVGRVRQARAERRRQEEERRAEMLRRVEENGPHARWLREQERRRREDAETMERVARDRRERALNRAYHLCELLAREDFAASPDGPADGRRHFVRDDYPAFAADWPRDRPPWWLPPPGMLEAVQAEPTCKPYGHREPDWRRWWPVPYVLGQVWPWRVPDGVPAASAARAPR